MKTSEINLHVHNCGHHHHTDAANRRDPSGTGSIRKRFEAEITRRFRAVRSLVYQSIAVNDALGLRKYTGDQALQPRQFEFVRSADKVGLFMSWLREEQRQIIIGTSMQSAARAEWADVYVDTAYRKGIEDAGRQLRQAGAQVAPSWVEQAFTRPIHADRLGLIHTRVYSELEGITATMDQQISRVLANGIAAGDNPLKIARDLSDRVSKIGITRARALARTEVMSAHAEAGLNGFEEAGLEGVEVVAEWLTAVDACPICAELEAGGPYTINEARGLIPAHPNCRCAWAPQVVNGTGIVLQ